VVLNQNTVIFQKGVGTYIFLYNKSQVCKTPIDKVDRNKYLTWNRCPLGNCE